MRTRASLVVVVLGRERVQRIASVTVEVTPLGRVDDEAVEPVVHDHGRDRVYPWTAVRPDRRQITETHTVLVDQLADRCGEARLGGGELGPRCITTSLSNTCTRSEA